MKKLLRKRQQKVEETPSRITNETVAEHRERILAGGRKFKYPVQYARHRLVFNTLIITLITLILLGVIGWWQLYPMQNTSAFMYRVTRILPLPVASVDGQPALYQDYLVQYRLSEYYLGKYGEIRLDSKDGKVQLDYVKRQALDQAEMVAYARKLAKQYNVTVTHEEINAFFDKERDTASGRVSQETYDASIKMLYGVSSSDYRLFTANAMLKNKVAFAIDDNATHQVSQVKTLIAEDKGDFAKVVKQMADSKGGKVTSGQSSLVDNTSKLGGLRVSEVAALDKGEISGALKSTTDDGYYFVKVVDKTSTQVNFIYIHIPLTQFTHNFDALKDSGKVHEYISVTQPKT